MFKTAKNVEKTLYKESDFGLAIFVDFPEGLTHDFKWKCENCFFLLYFFLIE